MDLHAPGAEADPDVVDAGYSRTPGQTPDTTALLITHRIDRITGPGDRPDLDSHPDTAIDHQEIDLTMFHVDVLACEGEPALG